jgi:predicted Zn finger-like uncharacterized protein
MNVSCPECSSVFRVDPAKVPDAGVQARCSVCGAVIAIGKRGAIGDDFAAPIAAQRPTPAPRADGAPERHDRRPTPAPPMPAVADRPAAEAPTPAAGSRPATPASVEPTRAVAEPSRPTPGGAAYAPPRVEARGEPRQAERPQAPTPPLARPAAPPPAPPSAPPRAEPGAARPATPTPAHAPSGPLGFLRAQPQRPGTPAAPAPAQPAAQPPRLAESPPSAPSRVAEPPRLAEPPRHAEPARPAQEADHAAAPAAPAPGAPAPTAAAAGGGRRPINPFLNNDPNVKARRLARALVSDIVTYFPDKQREGIGSGSLKMLFREEIKKSYEEYVEQVGKELAESTSHFRDALNDILAGGQRVF